LLKHWLVMAGWLAVMALTVSVLAGTTGTLTGHVVDAKKQPLAGVNLAIPLARTGAVTDAQGRYNIVNVPAGTYDVKA